MTKPNPAPAGRDRYALVTLLMMGGMFAVCASPMRAMPLLTLLLLGAIPFVTFSIVAPRHVTRREERGLLWGDLEAFFLGAVARFSGRADAAEAVRATHKVRVERTYGMEGLQAERLHHARRVGLFATLWIAVMGMAIPAAVPGLTYGTGFSMVVIAALDLAVLLVLGRVLTERMAMHLLRSTGQVQARTSGRVPGVLLGGVLGGPIGAISGILMGAGLGLTSALETRMMMPLAYGIGPIWAYVGLFTMIVLFPAMLMGVVMGASIGMTRVNTAD